MVEFWETSAVGEPGGVLEDGEEESVLFCLVVELHFYCLPEDVDSLAGLGDELGVEGVKQAKELEPHVEASVDDFFDNSETSGLVHQILITMSSAEHSTTTNTQTSFSHTSAHARGAFSINQNESCALFKMKDGVSL